MEQRTKECPEVTIHLLPLHDDLHQELCIEDLRNITKLVLAELDTGGSVLVHCAQGRSRSSTVVVSIMCWARQLSVQTSLAFIREKRSMAEPNSNFVNQLQQFEKLEYFTKL